MEGRHNSPRADDPRRGNYRPEVIYHLKSFVPSVVSSAVSNFLVSQYTRRQGIQVLLSGEGGDEVFCGYDYLKDVPADDLFRRQIEYIGFLHNNAALRLDQINQCHSLRVIAPLIPGELSAYALSIPPEFKQTPEGGQKIDKWIFRKAFESHLPEELYYFSVCSLNTLALIMLLIQLANGSVCSPLILYCLFLLLILVWTGTSK